MEPIYINGWWFDFDRMKAFRDPNWMGYKLGYPEQIRDLRFLNGQIQVQLNVILWKEAMFDEPEDCYNEEILQAYLRWAVEKEVLMQS